MTNRNARSGFRAGRNQDAVQENIELLTGQRGNGLDRAITVRELAQLGLIGLTRNGAGNVITKPLPPTIPDTDKPVEVPHAPNGFMAYGGFGSIMLEWQLPTFSGFAHAEIWRAAPNIDGSSPNLDQSVLVATTPATVFGDVVDPGSTFYYWCRFVNIKDFAGPYHGVDGVKVSTSQNISDIIDDIGSQMQESELIQGLIDDIAKGDKVVSDKVDTVQSAVNGVSATVQQNSTAISEINKDGSTAHKAIWGTKAQAGDIKAGIGILAKSDGTSQVAVSASQFFVFDPNKAGAIQPLFAIDKGNVVIPKALIESATIQILNAQTIVADEVKVGVSISSPTITGGFFGAGWAGFGVGGRHSGYHTAIYANGHIVTDNITAHGGSFTGTVNANSGKFNNVTISSSCTVYGTIYANKIVGDLVAVKGYVQNSFVRSKGANNEVELARFYIRGGMITIFTEL
ncbi:phage tail tip fiber protein [Photobacterium leiognathi subsp. mandapamensis]